MKSHYALLLAFALPCFAQTGDTSYSKEFRAHPDHALLSKSFAKLAREKLEVIERQTVNEDDGGPDGDGEARRALEELQEAQHTQGEWLIWFEAGKYSSAFLIDQARAHGSHAPAKMTDVQSCGAAIVAALDAGKAPGTMPACDLIGDAK